MKILFIGIGKMGLPMATHLLQSGYTVKVIDLNEKQIELAKNAGLTEGQETDYLEADWIISSMPNDAAFIKIVNHLSQTLKPGSRYIDTSTVSITASSNAAKCFEEKQIQYLRVAVSGNNHMAKAAQLTILSSGERDLYNQAYSILACWGPKVIYLGPQEQARLMKLVVNLMIAQTSAMLAEGLTLGRLGNLDWQDMWEVITNSAVGSPIMKAKMAQLGKPIAERDFAPTFTVTQMMKDLTLIMQVGKEYGAPLTQTQMTFDWMQEATQDGEADLDYAAIIQVLERKAGLGS